MTQNWFCFVAPMFNASATLARMLHSLYGQSYDNWSLILIDDVSSEGQRDACVETVEQFNRLDDRILTIWNDDKKWEVANVLAGINLIRDNEAIVCRIDADDWLVDLDCLTILNSVYASNPQLDAVWTAHRWGFSDKSISNVMPAGADPYVHPWVSSHLKTFRRRLLNDVSDANFRGPDGGYIRRAGDQAIYLPALRNARQYAFLPRVMYHYTIDDRPETYQTDDAMFQRDEALFLRQRGYVK